MAKMDKTVSRMVFQRCTRAKLQLSENNDDNESNYAVLNSGLIVYVAFLGEVPDAKLQKLASVICNTKLCEKDGELVSVLNLPGDLLLVPHFCLGGRLKGKQFQYHGIASKEQGGKYFKTLVDECRDLASACGSWKSSGSRVFAGTYGIRQILSFESNGPYTHMVEI